MKTRIAATGLIALAAFGCEGSGAHHGMPNAYIKLPPPPPPRQNLPLDAGLRREAESEIARDFASGDPILRANSIEATQTTKGVNAAPRLISALTDRDPTVRFAGAMACGVLRVVDAKDRLLTMVNDTDVNVQVAVRFALHRLGDTRLSHDFEKLARDPDDAVRSNTALALGLLGEPSALNVLGAMRHDLSPTVRLQVIEAMWRLGDTDARDKLVMGTISVHPDDQIVSLLALAEPHDPVVLRYVRSQLTSDYEEVNLAAARACGMLGTDDGMAIALKNAYSKDVRQRSMAARALGDIARSDAQPTLRDLLHDHDASVRLAAATAILQLKEG